eukprot:scaffold2429_cov149-Skeletonema_menzelii.AAC.14
MNNGRHLALVKDTSDPNSDNDLAAALNDHSLIILPSIQSRFAMYEFHRIADVPDFMQHSSPSALLT